MFFLTDGAGLDITEMRVRLITKEKRESGMAAKDYIDLANLNKDLLVSRRQIEWKVSLSFWGGIIGLVGFLFAKEYNRANHEITYWLLFFFLFICGAIFTYWHISINGSHRKDLDQILYFREKAEAELGNSTLKPERPTEDLEKLSAFKYALKRSIHTNCFLPHAMITLIILIGSMLILGS